MKGEQLGWTFKRTLNRGMQLILAGDFKTSSIVHSQKATLPSLLTPVSPTAPCPSSFSTASAFPERGKNIPVRNSPIKITQAWKNHNPYGKLSTPTSDGNTSAGFGRILYTDDVADPENLLLTPAQSSWALDLHYYFFFLANISKTAITCCFWTLLF